VNGVNALFDRQSWAGLVTPFGAVIAGRQYTPGYETFVKFNSFADGFAGNPGQIASINLRANNALQYRAELKGFTFGAMYGFGGAEGSSLSPNNRTERVTVPSGDDFWGMELQYQTERFGVAGAYQQNRTVTYFKPTENQKGLQTYNFGAWVAFGDFKLYGHYLKSTNDNPVFSPAAIQDAVIKSQGNLNAAISTLSSFYLNAWDVNTLRGVAGPTDASVYHLGLEWLLGSGRLLAAYNYGKDTSRSPWATADASVSTYSLAYYYYLSKRTWLYGAGALASNSDQSRIALGGAGYRGGWTTGFGEDNWSLQLGMRHMF